MGEFEGLVGGLPEPRSGGGREGERVGSGKSNFSNGVRATVALLWVPPTSVCDGTGPLSCFVPQGGWPWEGGAVTGHLIVVVYPVLL